MKIEKVWLGQDAYYPNRNAWKVSQKIDGEEWGILCTDHCDVDIAIEYVLNTVNLTPEQRKKL